MFVFNVNVIANSYSFVQLYIIITHKLEVILTSCLFVHMHVSLYPHQLVRVKAHVKAQGSLTEGKISVRLTSLY